MNVIALLMSLTLTLLSPVGILDRINQKRPDDLTVGSCLTKRANAHARKLARSADFYHSDMDVLLDGCGGPWVGQIMARGSWTNRSVVRAWLDSPPHRSILKSNRAERFGIGMAQGVDGRTYIVVNFEGQ